MNVRSVDFLSEEKKAENQNGNVKTADTSTQETKTEPAFKLPSKAELLKNPMKYIAVAISQFQALSEEVKLHGQAIEIMAQTNERLMPLVELAERAKQAQQAQAQAQARGETPSQGGSPNIMQILGALASGGGGGSDPYREQMVNRMMELSLKKMEQGLSATDKIVDAVVSQIATKAVKQVIEKAE